MIGYLDTSAFVPLIVAESSSAACQRFWDDADAISCSRLLYVEAAAALAQARRLDRLSSPQHRAGAEQLADPGLVAAAGDTQLLAAWAQLGLATYDTDAPPQDAGG